MIRGTLAGSVTVICVLGFFTSACTSKPRQLLRDQQHDLRVQQLTKAGFKILVETGDENSAKAYYSGLKTKIGFDPETSDLGGLVTYFGYANLSPTDLEGLDPKALMRNQPGILAARFFAPKIVDFNAQNPVSPDRDVHTPGWRRLVTLTSQPGSPAERAGLASAYVLFNVFQGDPTADPFSTESVNTQVMLIPKTFSAGTGDAAYWLDYQPRSNGYKISYALNAAFDVPSTPGGGTKHNYFVPTACAQCHGHDEEFGDSVNGAYPFAKLNYLDTDQWYDMVGFDFPVTRAKGPDVLVDGGKDHASTDYHAAIAIVRKINTAILAQNRSSLRADGSDAFKISSNEKWLAIHAGNDDPQPPVTRALAIGAGTSWNPGAAGDTALLEHLDRYCSRCHGSMYYNVFDKQAVKDKRQRLIGRINSGSMPQGRTLSSAERSQLVDLLKQLP